MKVNYGKDILGLIQGLLSDLNLQIRNDGPTIFWSLLVGMALTSLLGFDFNNAWQAIAPPYRDGTGNIATFSGIWWWVFFLTLATVALPAIFLGYVIKLIINGRWWILIMSVFAVVGVVIVFAQPILHVLQEASGDGSQTSLPVMIVQFIRSPLAVMAALAGAIGLLSLEYGLKKWWVDLRKKKIKARDLRSAKEKFIQGERNEISYQGAKQGRDDLFAAQVGEERERRANALADILEAHAQGRDGGSVDWDGEVQKAFDNAETPVSALIANIANSLLPAVTLNALPPSNDLTPKEQSEIMRAAHALRTRYRTHITKREVLAS